jgi:hypothetical protein
LQDKQQNQNHERQNMNNKFDELTKSMAQSVTRRAALKKFTLGLAAMALACFGLANKAEAAKHCTTDADCSGGSCLAGVCLSNCDVCVNICMNVNRGNRGDCKKQCQAAGSC